MHALRHVATVRARVDPREQPLRGERRQQVGGVLCAHPEQARDLWRAAGAKDELWLLDVGHNEGWRLHREEYERRVIAFLDHALEADIHEPGGPSAAGAP